MRDVRAWMLVIPVEAVILLLPLSWNPDQWKAVLATAVLAVALLNGGGRYRAKLHLSVLDEMPSILSRLLIVTALVATVIALRHDQESVTVYLENMALVSLLVVLGRVVTTAVIRRSRRLRITVHRTILIGGGPLSVDLATALHQEPAYGLEVVGFVDDDDNSVAGTTTRRLGGLDDLERAVLETGTDVLLVADGAIYEHDLLDAVRAPACVPCDLLIVPRLHHFQTQTALSDRIGSVPIMRIRTPALKGPARVVKRAVDVVVSALLLVVTAPLVAVLALAVRIEGGPGVIFRQPRVGQDGQVFECLKLRSLRPLDAADAAERWSIASDDRIGPVGKLLRRTGLDELPQLWNILKGDMSLVGPRPERPLFVDRFSEEYDRYGHRLRVQAGLTGLAQVNGLRGDTSIADRARYDNFYIENWTLWLDIKIVIRTFAEIALARGR